jgi:hypothetical protein
MKKNIILKIILIIELALVLLFGLGNVFSFFKDTPVFNIFYILGNQLFVFGKTLASLFHINVSVNDISYINFSGLIGFVIANVIFIILYYGIWYLVSFIIKKHNEDKLRSVVEKYELTKSEKSRFQVRNYIHTFSPYVFISLIIPIVFLFIIITARFDVNISKEASSKLGGTLTIFTNNIEPALKTLFLDGDFHKIILSFFTRSTSNGYIDIMNVWFFSVPWVEYILIVFSCVLILFIWFIIFQAIYLLVRKPIAKVKCDNARKAYIYKMEHQEYRIRKEYKNEVSSKSDDFIRTLEEEVNSNAKNIANITKEENEELLKNPKSYEKNRRAYLEDIGYGVSDLGVSESDIEKAKPIVEREVRYISDEDIDIILEEEPVIEVTEDEIDASIEDEENDEFFEKYIPEEQEIEDIKPLSEDVEQYIFENISNDDLISEDDLNKDEDQESIDELNALEGSLPEEQDNKEKSIIENEPIKEEENNVNEEQHTEEVSENVIKETLDNQTNEEDTIQEPSNEEIKDIKDLIVIDEVRDDIPVEEEKLSDVDTSFEEVDKVDNVVYQEDIDNQETPNEDTPDNSEVESSVVIEEVRDDIPVEEDKLSDVDTSFEEVKKVDNVVYQEDIDNQETQDEVVSNDTEVEPSIDNETNSEEQHPVIKKKKAKYNPFLQYFNPRTKGYGAKKVPSFKQLAEEKKKNK